MRVETELKLDFDAVLIRPKRSVAPSRASVDLQRSYRFRSASPAATWAGTPIMASNMDTVGTMQMAQVLHGLTMNDTSTRRRANGFNPRAMTDLSSTGSSSLRSHLRPAK